VIGAFASRAEWDAWLAAEHEKSSGVWLKLAKKGSGIESVSHAEAVEAALCYGWIDGQARSIDENYWLARFPPRAALTPGKTVTVVGYPNRTDPEEMRAERIIVDGKTTELR